MGWSLYGLLCRLFKDRIKKMTLLFHFIGPSSHSWTLNLYKNLALPCVSLQCNIYIKIWKLVLEVEPRLKEIIVFILLLSSCKCFCGQKWPWSICAIACRVFFFKFFMTIPIKLAVYDHFLQRVQHWYLCSKTFQNYHLYEQKLNMISHLLTFFIRISIMFRAHL